VLVAIGVVALLGVAGYFVWRFAWHRASRRYLIRLISRKESIAASQRTLEAVLRHLADEPDEALLEFAQEVESLDRRALAEEHQRAVVLADELATMPMPKRLVPVADALADAAEAVADEAGRIKDDQGADEVLESLQAVDLERVNECFEKAESLMDEAAYTRRTGQNVVVLVKYLSGDPESTEPAEEQS
jgi:hypothetical protein